MTHAGQSMVYRLICFSLLLIWLAPHTTADDKCRPAEGEPLRIGAVFPQETLLTAASSDSYLGAEAMRQAVNECGGVAGRSLEWEWMPANDRYSAIESVQALSEVGIPVIVGSGSSAVSAGALEAADAEEIVYWEVSESLEKSSDWAFSPRLNNYQLGQYAADLIDTQFPDARIALVYEERAAAQTIAAGIRDTLAQPPVLERSYSDPNDYADTYALATRVRDEKINVLMLITFESDGFYLWYEAREADANVEAWLHVGSEGYWRGLCARELNIEGFMSLTPYAPVSTTYRAEVIGEIDNLYRAIYQRENSEFPSLEANLSASGIYLLLHYILPAVQGDFTAENVRTTIRSLDLPAPVGMFGEGLRFEGSDNMAGIAPVRQQQGRQFCTLFPSSIATCLSDLLPFPTWRERALKGDTGWQCLPEI